MPSYHKDTASSKGGLKKNASATKTRGQQAPLQDQSTSGLLSYFTENQADQPTVENVFNQPTLDPLFPELSAYDDHDELTIPNLQPTLKCICNEIFDVGIFALSKNIIFSDHFDTNLVEKFRLEVGKFLD